MDKRLMDAKEVAKMLHVPETWVRDHTRSGTLPHVTLGRYKRYRFEAIVEWVEQQQTNGAAWRKYRPTLEK